MRDGSASNWQSSPRWQGIKRPYSYDQVVKLRPRVASEAALARNGAAKMWDILTSDGYTPTLGVVTGSQAVNAVRAGLQSLYISGWQVAADANTSLSTYPDQSLYPVNSVPTLVTRINRALQRADQVGNTSGADPIDWYVPIVADAEAGFGGSLHAFELMRSMIEAGAAAVHFEDQLASEKKCGHLGGKVLVPTSQFIKTLIGARLAADVMDVPTCIIARTDALGAKLLTSDIDEYDREHLIGERTPEGFFRTKPGIGVAIARGLAYAPYSDALWVETSTPSIAEAQQFAEAIHREYPGKALAYNCSPSFNWESNLSRKDIASFQKDLGQLGYRFQFITLAGWHAINYHTFDLAYEYKRRGMLAYADLQSKEFASEAIGYTAVRHQQEVGTGYFDQVLDTITGGTASTSSLKGSTEAEQFGKRMPVGRQAVPQQDSAL